MTNTDDVRARVHACWIGKAVGGTLGQSFEGLTGPLAATFYDPVPTTMMPNDDLDLQVVWALTLDGLVQPRVDRQVLADAWLRHVGFPFNEYGVAIRNLHEGIRPPLSGSYDNWFAAGEGAAIRSELWACLAWGDPALAAAYAYEDACVDHADDGIWAAQFLAALQAGAFVESSPDVLLDDALAQIPASSAVARSVQLTRRLVGEGLPWQDVRAQVYAEFGTEDFTDVRFNIAFVVLGWLAGRDFGERILICTNCGGDADSTTASLGSLLGILDPAGLPEAWTAPIGDDLVLSPPIVGITPPSTLDDFTDLVLALEARLARSAPPVQDEISGTVPALRVEATFTDRYQRHRYIRTAFMPPADELPALEGWEPFDLPGSWHRMPRAEFLKDLLVLRYQVSVDDNGDFGVMVNASEQVRVWLDGAYLFGRDIGGMGEKGSVWPAAQHPPLHQFAPVRLTAGTHELVVALRKPPLERDAEWVVGVYYDDTKMWVPRALQRVSPALATAS